MKHFCPRSHYRLLLSSGCDLTKSTVSTSTLFLWLEASSLKSVSLALDSRGWISIWFLFPILSFFHLNPGFHPKWEEEWALTLKTVSTIRLCSYQSPACWPGTFPKPISSHWWLLAGVWELSSPTWITTHTLTIKRREVASEWCVVWGFWRKCIPRLESTDKPGEASAAGTSQAMN